MREVTVEEGETWKHRLDDGETLENVVIDISADGAGYSLHALANDWTIRNVGVRGKWDYEPSNSPFTLSVPDGEGSGVVRNFYLGDGGPANTGIYVHADHAGDLVLRNLNIQNVTDNGLYASDPGSPERVQNGQGGAVRVYDSYFRNNENPQCRLGTDESLAKNCVAVNETGGTACFRDYWGAGVTFVNCDAYAPYGGGFKSGSSTWNERRDVRCRNRTYLENCRAKAAIPLYGPCRIEGRLRSEPRTEPPSGVPTSASEAAYESLGGSAGR